MSRDRHDKPPLYRKVNTRTHHVHHDRGGDYRHERNSKAARERRDEEVKRESMGARVDRGLDYTPLYRFLFSKVGQPWAAVLAQARTRVDKPDPIFWMVATSGDEPRRVVRTGDNSYWSGLYVDEAGVLRVVAPEVTHETMMPSCACCTHTLNGMRLTRRFLEPLGDPED